MGRDPRAITLDASKLEGIDETLDGRPDAAMRRRKGPAAGDLRNCADRILRVLERHEELALEV